MHIAVGENSKRVLAFEKRDVGKREATSLLMSNKNIQVHHPGAGGHLSSIESAEADTRIIINDFGIENVSRLLDRAARRQDEHHHRSSSILSAQFEARWFSYSLQRQFALACVPFSSAPNSIRLSILDYREIGLPGKMECPRGDRCSWSHVRERRPPGRPRTQFILLSVKEQEEEEECGFLEN